MFFTFSVFANETKDFVSSYRILVASIVKDKSKKVSSEEIKLRDELISYLTYTDKVEVIDREKLKSLLKEQAIGQLGVLDEKSAPQAGKLLGAKKMAFIRVNKNSFTISLTDVESGKEDLAVSGRISEKEKVFKEFVKNIEHKVFLHNMSLLKNESSDLKITILSNKKKFKNNESIQFTLSVNEDCFLYLLLIQSNGEIFTLFPNSDHKKNFVKANTKIEIPENGSGYIFTAGEPFGVDVVKAIVSKEELNLFQSKKVDGTPFDKVEESPDDVIRGIKKISVLKSTDWNSEEISIEIVK